MKLFFDTGCQEIVDLMKNGKNIQKTVLDRHTYIILPWQIDENNAKNNLKLFFRAFSLKIRDTGIGHLTKNYFKAYLTTA